MFMWQSGSTLDSLAALVRQFNRFLKDESRDPPIQAILRTPAGPRGPAGRPGADPRPKDRRLEVPPARR